MREVQAAGARLAVRDWGPDGGKPVLFWHALGPSGSGETIVEAVPALAKRGFRVHAVDGPGFGESEALAPERYELEALLELVDALVAELALGPFVFMGHSWGGSIAVHYAARRADRVRALVLLDSGHIDYGALPDVDADRPLQAWIDDARARPWRWPSEQAFADELAAAVQRWSPDLLQAYLAGLHREGAELVGSSPEARGAAFRGLAVARQSDAWPRIREAGIPVLLLLATLPPHVDVNERLVSGFIQALPHADVRWVENAGHGLLADAGPALGEQIGDWLAQVPA
jgi:pimeloyl-ACP methyl ester carboxylesterase